MKARDTQFIFQRAGDICRHPFSAIRLKFHVGFRTVAITVVRQYGQGFNIIYGFAGHGFCRYGTAQVHVGCRIIIRYSHRRRGKGLVFAFCRGQHGRLVRTPGGSRKSAPGSDRVSSGYVDLCQPVTVEDSHPCIDAVRRIVVFCILDRMGRQICNRIRIGGQPDSAIGLETALHVRYCLIGKFYDPHGNDRDRRGRIWLFFIHNRSLKP